jgi:cystathionine beta-lyase
LRLRQNVFGRAKACAFRTTARPTRKNPKPDWSGPARRQSPEGFGHPAVFHGSTVLYPTAEDLHAHRGEFT